MKFIVKLDEVLPQLDIPDYFALIQGNEIATYNTMLLCVANDEGELLKGQAAKDEMRKAGKMRDWPRIRAEFISAFADALVPPVSGNG
jgi:hypothetical protein